MTHTPNMETTMSEATTSMVILMPNSVNEEAPVDKMINLVQTLHDERKRYNFISLRHDKINRTRRVMTFKY
jgi:hypothetical protein